MGLDINRLVFDATDTGNLDDYANVGSFLRASDGTLLTHTDVNGKKALDVNVENEITAECDLDGVYDAGTNAEPDSVGILAHARGASLDETSQGERFTAAAPAADVDPANVVGLDVNAFMAAWDGTDFQRVEIDGGSLKTRSSSGSIQTAAVSVASTATQLQSSPLSGRREITIQNLGNKALAVGEDNSVTFSSGLVIERGSSATFMWDSDVDPHAISEQGTLDVRILEAA